jgi:hypothetical protein
MALCQNRGREITQKDLWKVAVYVCKIKNFWFQGAGFLPR